MTFTLVLLSITPVLSAKSASEIALGLDKLATSGSVLYVAAHPDDENTRLLSYLANEYKLRTAYVSLTRGDGGQNLIGTEQADLLGVIRTHELLAARRIDGAEQFFTRAVDFGYSKTTEESLRFWGHEEILGDLVWVIRRFQPDVIITRFETGGRPTHGHHTASAVLAAEAFVAAADGSRFPEQLAHVQPWKATRLLYNVSHWALTPESDTSAYLTLDVGRYSPLLGQSMGEVAGKSRSMHKSQGFGAAEDRGPIAEYFTFLAGDDPKAHDPNTRDPFAGLEFSWKNFEDGSNLLRNLDQIRIDYRPHTPHLSAPKLLKILPLLSALPKTAIRDSKIRDTQELLTHMLGLHLEANATVEEGLPGQVIPLRIEAYARASYPVTLKSVRLPDGTVIAEGNVITPQKPAILTPSITLSKTERWTRPYWLDDPQSPYRHTIPDVLQTGDPLGPIPLPVTFTVVVDSTEFDWTLPLSYKWVDPVDGERRRTFVVTPPVSVTFEQPAVVVPQSAPVPVRLILRAARYDAKGTVRIQAPSGFAVAPDNQPFEISAQGEEQIVTFTVTAPDGSSPAGNLVATVEIDGGTYSTSRQTINHTHLSPMVIHTPASVPVRTVDLKKPTVRIGYVEGPGDKVADSLRQVGMNVEILNDAQILGGALSPFDTIVVGVRVYSSTPRIKSWQPYLLDFVEKGGTLVVQYSTKTPRSQLITPIAPFSLEIGRERVTDENSPVVFLDPKHPLLVGPNPVSLADFEGWVQERGLYFAEKWADVFVPVLGFNDPGEPVLQGSLLVAPHGKGHIIYTGLAFFRQLPAGVPGAYRLFSNVVHYGQR